LGLGWHEEAMVPETVWGFNKFTWIYKNAGSGVSLEHDKIKRKAKSEGDRALNLRLFPQTP
jgi:hypothetical protein